MALKLKLIAAGCVLALSTTVKAGTMGPLGDQSEHPWSVVGSLGYTWYDGAYSGGPSADVDAQPAIGDGQTPFGRLAIARDLYRYQSIQLGAELGVQSGNNFRLNIPSVELDLIGGVMVQGTIKPLLDLLVTAAWKPNNDQPIFGVVKLGVAYRRMQINDRVTFNDLSQAAGEVQAGIGMQISDRATLSLNYQGIYNGKTTYTIDTSTSIGEVSNIPMQNGILLSIGYKV